MTKQDLIEATTDEFAMRIVEDTLLKHTTPKQLLDILLTEEGGLKTSTAEKQTDINNSEQPTIKELNELTWMQSRLSVLQYTIRKLQRIAD